VGEISEFVWIVRKVEEMRDFALRRGDEFVVAADEHAPLSLRFAFGEYYFGGRFAEEILALHAFRNSHATEREEGRHDIDLRRQIPRFGF